MDKPFEGDVYAPACPSRVVLIAARKWHDGRA